MNKLFFIIALSASLTGYAQTTNDYYLTLKKYEGYERIPYGDTVGYTVGIGHHLTDDEPFRVYTDEEILILFRTDLHHALSACHYAIADFDSLPIDVKQVCVGLTWTVGRNGLVKFVKFRRALSMRNYREAARELKDSCWYHQVSRRRANDYIRTLENAAQKA